jgi:hypothetical protein
VDHVKVPLDPKAAQTERRQPAAGHFTTHGVH